MVKKKIFLVLVLFAGLFFGVIGLSFAQQQAPSLDVLKNQLPGGPVSNFINSIQNIGTDLNFQSDAWPKINDWFYNTTGGTNLTDLLKFAGNLLIWFFSLFINLTKLALSLL